MTHPPKQTTRFFVTHNGLGGGYAETLSEALENYKLVLKLNGLRWAYRGTKRERVQ